LITALPVLPVIAHEGDCPTLILFSQLWYNPLLVGHHKPVRTGAHHGVVPS
jgi:hypothetical protein